MPLAICLGCGMILLYEKHFKIPIDQSATTQLILEPWSPRPGNEKIPRLSVHSVDAAPVRFFFSFLPSLALFKLLGSKEDDESHSIAADVRTLPQVSRLEPLKLSQQ